MPRWNAWQCRFGSPGSAMPATCSAPVARRVGRDARDRAVRDVDAHVARPAGGQQRVVEEQVARHASASAHPC